MMATTARVEVMKKIIELVDFPVQIVGGESINWETEFAGRFAEAQRLYFEFTTSFNEPLLRYFPILPPPPPPTVVIAGSTAPPPKEETGEIESSDQNIRTGFVVKRKRMRNLSEIYKDCVVVGYTNKLPRVNRTCKSAAIEIKNESENSLDNNNKSVAKKKPNKQNMKNKLGMGCSHCKASTTPMWRDGPSGPNSLCNACGLRLKKWGCLDLATRAE